MSPPGQPVNASERQPVRWAPPLLALLCLAAFLRVSAIGWGNPILGYFAFRQTQTAIGADAMLREGFSIAYETPVLGAPWQLPFEFPTYQWCVVAVVKLTGLPLEPAGRAVSVAFALGAFALLGMFVRRGTGSPAGGWFAAGLALTMPLYLFDSRSFMIESTALCCALGFLVTTQSFLQVPRWTTLGWVFATGLLAGLTKATTYAAALAGVAALVLAQARTFTGHSFAGEPADGATDRSCRIRHRLTGTSRWALGAGLLAALAGPFALSLAWVAWTDAVKLRNELAAFTTSSALHDWNYGTWAQRLLPVTWRTLGSTVAHSILGSPLAWVGVLTAAAALWLTGAAGHRSESDRRDRGAGSIGLFLVVCLAAFVAGPLVFTNLYFVHEYYFYAVAVYLAGAGGAILGAAWETRRGTAARLGIAAATALLAIVAVTRYASQYYPAQKAVDRSLPAFAAEIAGVTPPDSVLWIEGSEWDSSLPYYAHRRALTNRTQVSTADPVLQRALARLDHPIGALVFLGRFKDDRYYIAQQIRGLHRPFERVLSSPLGTVYVPVTAAPGPHDGSEWKRAGFADVPLFAYAPTVAPTNFAGRPAMLVHAPGMVLFERAPAQTALHVGFGLREDAYTGGHATDGVTFVVEYTPVGGKPVWLLQRRLDPLRTAADRAPQEATIPLPGATAGTIILYTQPGPGDAFDWSVWRDVWLE